MPVLHTEQLSGKTSPVQPELPPGWHYADDAAWEEARAPHRARKLVLGVAVAILIAAALAGLVIWNASAHYARGVAALNDHSYATAINEFSAAKLVVLPYRDAAALEDQARSDYVASIATGQKAQAREDRVSGALDKAGLALDDGQTGEAVAALTALKAGDVRAALRDSAQVHSAAGALVDRLTAAASDALRRAQWGEAGRLAAAALVLEPLDPSATALGERAATGQALGAKLAEARTAAARGQWRTALRLALAVTAARKDFPGAATLVTRARVALAPKPKPKATAAASTSTATTSSSGSTSSGSSSGGSSSGSGSSSQPPPP